ncbi:hypothetical protein [Pyxidicoccus caerfyrddinensis]|uniref:hypothetical protein n=1 Tax=Pyxidicoccus caerfyrddinensis TaxID=2709663 RepID=UPI0013DC0B09|nr:hypothetical protein [Pyxidicoccus caerfyrddinensis]
MHSYLRALVLVPLLAVASSCVTISKQQYANVTAGAIGCPVEEVQISGEKESFGLGEQVTPWTAECRGRRFICSSVGHNASCKEELKAAEAPAAAPAEAQATDAVK